MKDWMKKIPPYEGEEEYLYFAFAEADRREIWTILRPLLQRGCRIWYCLGPAGGAEELLHRQERSGNAMLTLVYLTDNACRDKDTKSSVLVNQKNGRPILCLDPDGVDRRLSMGLREDVPHVSLSRKSPEKVEDDIIHAEGFSGEIIGETISVPGGDSVRTMTRIFCVLAGVLLALSFVGVRYLSWFRQEPPDEVVFTDLVILSAVKASAGGGVVTEELVSELTFLPLEDIPENWDELTKLPALKRIALPQTALLGQTELPELPYTVELSGGEGE